MGAISQSSARRMHAVVRACILVLIFSPVAFAETIQTVTAAKPAPGGERRLALVIGNSAYKTAPLRNPVNDARAVSKALAGTGFHVTLIEDAGRATMRRAVRDWGDDLARGGVGLFYFAGHGMQIRGRNYLIPVTADVRREDEVEDEAVDANTVLAKMDSAKNALNIMILDACRNNPFQRSFRTAAQGLAQMDAPSGTLIAFATAPGSVAADGEGENGIYTKHLLAEMRQPGVAVEQLFKQVRIGVMAETKERQVPWESSSLRGDFYFFAPTVTATTDELRRQQQAAIDRAVSDATRAADQRAARERVELERRTAEERAVLETKMQELIAQLLAKQKSELDAEVARRTQAQASAAKAPALAPAAPPAPGPAPATPPTVQIAAIAPTAERLGSANPLLPKPGDHWTYRSRSTDPSGAWNEVAVEVKAVLGDSILESRRMRGRVEDWVYSRGAYIIGNGNPSAFYIFTPYVFAYEPVKEGDVWRDIPYQRLGDCSDNFDFSCRFDAKVVAREKVTVAAGTFQAMRIEIDHDMRGRGWSAQRKATFWYAPDIKRHIKATWKHVDGRRQASDGEAELVSYKLN